MPAIVLRSFVGLMLLNPPDGALKEVSFFFTYRHRNWDGEQFLNLPKVTLLKNDFKWLEGRIMQGLVGPRIERNPKVDQDPLRKNVAQNTLFKKA